MKIYIIIFTTIKNTTFVSKGVYNDYKKAKEYANSAIKLKMFKEYKIKESILIE